MVVAPMRLLYGLVISVYLALQINANAYPLLELLPLRVRHPLYDAINHELFIDQLQNVQCYPLYEHIELVQVSPDTDAFQLDLSSLMAELTVDSRISSTNPAFLQQCLKPLYDALDVIDFQDATQVYKPLPIISIVYLSSEIMSGEDNDLKQKLLQKIYEVATPLSLQRDQVLFAQGKPLLATQCLIPVLPSRELLVGPTNWVLQFTDYKFGFQIIRLIIQRLDQDAHADYMAHITSKALNQGKKELSSMIFRAYYHQHVDKISTFYEMCVKLINNYDTKNSLEGVFQTLFLVKQFNQLAGIQKEIKDLDMLAASTFGQSLVHCQFVTSAFYKICQKESLSPRDFDIMVIAFRSMNDAELKRYFRPSNNGLHIFLQMESSKKLVLAKFGLFTLQELSSPQELHQLDFETRFALIYRQLSLDQLKDHNFRDIKSSSSTQAGSAVAFNQQIFLKALVSGVFDQSIMSSFRWYYLQVNGQPNLALLNKDWTYCTLLGRLQNLLYQDQDQVNSVGKNELVVNSAPPIQPEMIGDISMMDGIPYTRRVVTTGNTASSHQDNSNLQSMQSDPLYSGQQQMDGLPFKSRVVTTGNTASSHQDHSDQQSMLADPFYSRQQRQYNLMGDTTISYDSGFPVLTTGAQFVPQYAMPMPHSRVVQTAAESKKRARPYQKRQKRNGTSGSS
ncbi:hypothetical protein MIR68_002586 [Amoeboaphelidium protococcarum]|nr:hypothetical protein MIR68_002586 [Amoeboaphelidium protococcarum]